MPEMKALYQEALAAGEELAACRRTLHQTPELGMDLPNTVAHVCRELEKLGIQPQKLAGGVTACIGKPGGKVFLLRGDMDALEMPEESGLPFAAACGRAHTCGHDLHTTMLLGAARLLKAHEGELAGQVKLMFQPGEENLQGAAAMVKAGILQNPRVDAALALHVFPGDCHLGTVMWRQGPALASSDSFRITVTGKAGHGAIPQNAVDPLNIAAHILLALQEVNAREVDPQDPLVLTVCTVHAGQLHNAIPENAVLTGSIRAFSNHNRALARERLVQICQGMAELFRGSCRVEFLAGAASLHNQPDLAAELAGYTAEIAEQMTELPKQMGSEDFAEVTQEVPSVFMGIGAGGPEEIYHQGGSHNPKVVFNEGVLPLGAAVLAGCAANWLEKHSR